MKMTLIQPLEDYINHCLECDFYSQQRCRHIFPDGDLPNPNRRDESNFGCPTQQSGYDLYAKIHKILKTKDIPTDDKFIRQILNELYRLRKTCHTEGVNFDAAIGLNVNDSSILELSYIDYAFLENGKDILKDIAAIKIGYTRKDGLFKHFAPELVKPLIEAASKPQQLKSTKTKKEKLDITPENYPLLFQYLDALKDDGFLDMNYKWIKKGHTNYHAGIAAKIIISHTQGIKYLDITNIIGITCLADHASECISNTNKKSYIHSIQTCFDKRQIPSTYC